jgi:4-hydroxy-tetrahydrodipicolinate synthase
MENTMKKFIPVMLTPFTSSGEIDYRGLDRLTDLYLEAGAGGLFANCLSSEMYELSSSERLGVINRIVRRVDGAVPVVATGSFGHTIEAQAGFVKEVYATGVEAVILISSLLATEDEDDAVWERRVDELLDRTPGIPVGFYECPVPYKRIMSAAQLGRLGATGRLRYHKDTCLDIDLVREKLAAVKEKDFGLYDAYMVHAVESLKAGSAGLSCIQGNYMPELVVWLCEHYDDSSSAGQVAEVQAFFNRHMDVMHRVYPVVAKYFLRERGLEISAFTRRQVGIYTMEVRDALDRLFREAKALERSLEITQAI